MKLMLGNEAIARGAYEAGVKVVSAYPGTPSTEVTENIARYDEVYAEWAPNEKVAAEVAIGSSISGNRCEFRRRKKHGMYETRRRKRCGRPYVYGGIYGRERRTCHSCGRRPGNAFFAKRTRHEILRKKRAYSYARAERQYGGKRIYKTCV